MKKLIIITGFILSSFASFGWHIVGGEIEFVTIEPGRYKINLIQYRDAAQQNNTVYEDGLTVYIYSKKTNGFVSQHYLSRTGIFEVPYTNQECARSELKTEKVIFSSEFNLDPRVYDHEEGYYIVYERCCRNETIKNIVSPSSTGMTYLLEIPPLWRNGAAFINSSPTNMKPLGDYACINQLYYSDFTGFDADGDSLVYRLTTPLNSSGGRDNPEPIPQPKPHSEVKWASGYSLLRVIPGDPSLKISREGFLQVNPTTTGVYVFSIAVEEWRDGVKIGQAKRDFQMLVVDGCDPPIPPVVGVKIPGKPTFDPEIDTLKYNLTDEKCFEFFITDIQDGENITLRTIPVNFTGDIENLFTIDKFFVDKGKDTLVVEICAPGCPPTGNKPFIVDLVASDDACPVPQLDTARLIMMVEPPSNILPNLFGINSIYRLDVNEVLKVPFRATDVDGDLLDMKMLLSSNEKPEDRGLSLDVTSRTHGELFGNFIWETNCAKYDLTSLGEFQVAFLPEDYDPCEVENTNYLWVTLGVNLPENTSPEVTIGIDTVVHISEGESLQFNVKAFDADNDTVSLKMISKGFSPSDIGVSFKNKEGVGSVSSEFNWSVACDLLKSNEREFIFEFVAEDKDRCQDVNDDLKSIRVIVDIPENAKPSFEQYADTIIRANSLFEIDISAFDADSEDTLTMTWFNPARLPKSKTLSFTSQTARAEVSSLLSWTPECSLLDYGVEVSYYDLIFLVYDDGCPIQKLDTMKIRVGITDPRDETIVFTPPNVFTPNGDGLNDVYSLTNLSNPSYNLPADNCDDVFEYIKIFDRSGTKVYESTEREFIWDGSNVNTGVYYYYIQYQRTNYKGYIHVMK